MVFLIQNSENRDAAAMQAKLDELIRAVRNARNEFVGIEHLTDHEIEAIRTALEQSLGGMTRDTATAPACASCSSGVRTRLPWTFSDLPLPSC